MSNFVPRLTAPSTTSKYWKHTSAGGVNSCILIANGSCLPNCVGYAWGRAYELLGKAPKLSKGNAENWYGYADGYSRGNTPKLGAIICWRKGKAGDASDGAGHVGVVEQINADGTITISQSAYGGTRFYLSKLKAPYSFGKYVFQGFIYIGNFTSGETKKYTNEEIANMIVNGQNKWGNGADRKNNLEAEGYNYTAIQTIINEMYANKNTTTTTATTLKVGDKAKVVKGAKWYGGESIDAWVFKDTFDVIEVAGDRIVIGKGKAVTGAINKKNLKKA